MLMIAFIGVRISWLIIARNDPLARFAADRLLPGRDQVSMRRLLRRDGIVYRPAELGVHRGSP